MTAVTALKQLLSRTGLPTTIFDACPHAPSWCYHQLRGRLVELSGLRANAALTAAFGVVAEVQRLGDPVAWVTRRQSLFYPPDVAASGVDLASLLIVRVPQVVDTAKASNRLLRSGAFGLIVLDLGAKAQLPVGVQGKLLGLAQHHDCGLLCLTEKRADADSLSSMVSLRAEATYQRHPPHQFQVTIRILKDKKRGPTWRHSEWVVAPDGL